MSKVRAIGGYLRGHPRWVLGAVSLCALIVLSLWLRLGPIAPELLDFSDTTSTMVVDRRGVPLYEALSSEGARSIRLHPENLPPSLVYATIAAEDRRFWSHFGVDPIAMLRAVRQNVAEGRIVEGGSTITQQVAKLLLNRRTPKRQRGWTEKMWEAVLALRLEHEYDKREILAMYLNLASYGNQIVGAQRASRAYFGCDTSMLTPAQAAFLSGLPQRPSGFNPYRNRQSATTRQRAVIRRMLAAGFLTSAQAEEARAEQLSLTRDGSPFLAPHFVEMVLAASADRPSRIETTIDASLQADIAGIIRSQRASLDRHGAANVAVVVLDNRRGEWIAWEGSGDYFDESAGGAINGPLTPRQPGSALKPFTYALAFEEGMTPASVLPDIPSHFPTAEAGVLYSPRNYDGRYRGPLLARRALAGSENVPAVALASNLGVPKLLRFLTRAGFTTFDRNPSYYGLGVTLGNAEVRLDELVAAYAAFARGGEWIEPAWTRAEGPRRTRRLVSPVAAYWITDILSDPEAREFIFGRGGNLEFPFPVAVKTGTSQAYHDNWTIGYTRDVTVGVWVGNFDRSPLRNSTGVTGAGPIFHGVMLAATRYVEGRNHGFAAREVVARPEGMVEREFCALSGMPATPWCPSRQREWVTRRDDLPCSWHHQSDEGLLVVWPAEYRQWARANGLLAGPTHDARISTDSAHEARISADPSRQTQRMSDRHEATATKSNGTVQIANPPAGATYLIDPTLRSEYQTLALRVTTGRPGVVEWSVNGQIIGTASSEGPLHWALKVGVHRIVVRDERGRTAETLITVR
jgi:penicillin-binding protein 1C